MRSISRMLLIALLGVGALAGCASQPSITGDWTPSDGSPTKVITDSGACTGMYYAGGKVLDIGGPETCSLGTQETDGGYLLVVDQSPNEATYRVVFSGNTLVLETTAGGRIVTLTRQ